jgi:HEAT repeat protein/beta-lactamase regulating signal transducer with metallopeptidase domain
MIGITDFAMHCLVNAAWQIAAVVIGASILARLLRNAAPGYRHSLWVATLTLSLALPLWGFLNLQTEHPLSRSERPAVAQLPSPENLSSAPNPTQPLPVILNTETSDVGLKALLRALRRPVLAPASLALALSLGYGLFLIYRLGVLIRRWWQAQLFRRAATSRELPALLASVASRCQQVFGLKRVPLLFSASASTPATVGAWNPVIILPESLYASTSEETLATMLGHEMAHISRRDYALNLVYEFLFLPISFHPLAVLVKRQISRTRELACDDMVTERLLEPQAYARSLVSVAGALALPAGRPLTLGVFDADILEERIMKLTQKTRRLGAPASRILGFCSFSLLCLTCIAISTFSLNLRTANSENPSRAVSVSQQVNDSRFEAQVPVQSDASSQDTKTTPANRAELAQKLVSADPHARAEAACLAGRSHAVEVIPTLLGMLGDDTPTQLVKCWEDGRWNPALESFKKASPGEQAAIALASMGAIALEPLTNALNDSNPSVRRNAAWAIGELTNMSSGERSGAVPKLVALLDDSDEWVRMASARSLGEIRDERATEGLIAHLSDREWRVRNLAAWSLGEMKEKRAVATLCDVLQSDAQFEVRKTTAWALAEIQDKRAVETLCNVLRSDAQAEVRVTTAWALGETKDKRAVDTLCHSLLTDTDADVRKNAAWALGEIQNRKALAALKQALSDPDERVRTKVMWAISEIEDADG